VTFQKTPVNAKIIIKHEPFSQDMLLTDMHPLSSVIFFSVMLSNPDPEVIESAFHFFVE
jgi:hypothetical protein